MDKVVFLDNGISVNTVSNCTINRYTVAEGTVTPDYCFDYTDNHSYLCIKYFLDFTDCHSISLINIMNCDNKCDSKSVLQALNWCQSKSVKLINMSLGTTNYTDWLSISSKINELVESGVIIVAALNNLKLPSWPAISDDVIAVQSDSRGLLEYAQLSYCYTTYGKITYVVNYSSPDDICNNSNYHNSFAAPVVSALIFNNLDNIHNVNEASSYLLSISKPSPYTKYPLMPDWKLFSSLFSPPPTMWVSHKMVNMVFHRLCDEVEIILLTDIGIGIPINLYTEENQLTSNSFSVLKYVYNPDVIICSTTSPPVNSKSFFDMIISEDGTLLSSFDKNTNKSEVDFLNFLYNNFLPTDNNL